MTARRRDANTEPRADLNIDTWGAKSCARCGKTEGQVEGQAEIAHYRGAVERNT